MAWAIARPMPRVPPAIATLTILWFVCRYEIPASKMVSKGFKDNSSSCQSVWDYRISNEGRRRTKPTHDLSDEPRTSRTTQVTSTGIRTKCAHLVQELISGKRSRRARCQGDRYFDLGRWMVTLAPSDQNQFNQSTTRNHGQRCHCRRYRWCRTSRYAYTQERHTAQGDRLLS